MWWRDLRFQEARLRQRFATEVEVRDDALDLDVNVTRVPHNYCENILRAVVEKIRPDSLSHTITESNGSNTFPDLYLEFSNGYSYDFESKSWLSQYRRWQAASASKFQEALRENDDKYLRTWFVDFGLVAHDDSVEIWRTQVGRMWDFCDGRPRTGRGKVGLVSGRSGSPEELVWYGSDRDEELYANGIAMLQNLGVNVAPESYPSKSDLFL